MPAVVDQSPKLNRLYYGILAAAVYLAATVPMVKPLCLAHEPAIGLGHAVGGMFLFLVPLALLAMTGPFWFDFSPNRSRMWAQCRPIVGH